MCSDAEGPGSKLCILSTQTLSCEYICSHLSGDASEQADTRENTGLLLHCMNARTHFYPTKRKKYQRRIFRRCRLSPENPVLRRYVSKDKRHFTYFEESFRRVSLVGSPRRNKLRGNSAISIEVTEEVGTWSHTPAFYCNFGGTFTDQFERMENNKITKRERIEREINERENRTKNGCKQMNVRLRWNTR